MPRPYHHADAYRCRATKGPGPLHSPFRYRVELQTAPNTWTTVIDRSDNKEDLLIDYRQCSPTKATATRLVIVGAPSGITPGVAEFTVFGDVARK